MSSIVEVTRIPLRDDELERLRVNYTPIREGSHTYVRTSPGNLIVPVPPSKATEPIHFKCHLKPTDVLIMAWPKCGMTWVEEMVWCILHNCDTMKAREVPIRKRNAFLDAPFLMVRQFDGQIQSEKLTSSDRESRATKTHLPFCLLPPSILDNCKAVLCLRNPKDTVTSYYHYEKLLTLHGYTGDFETHFDLFMDNLVMYSPYWEYVTQAWKKRNNPNLCILFYEDLKKDLGSQIQRVAKFLNKELNADQLKSLGKHLSFNEMRSNTSVNYEGLRAEGLYDEKQGVFMRKGEIGDWKNYFTNEMNKRMDEVIAKHFDPIGLKFEYE
eukprot:Seg183.1 transcript_id=Seg183.1/GoldUCD/mRNA.D3Y31 product="Sulfotransferase 1C4" protein_id=Seg183.1/GoldUCD/D3Y31